MSKITSVEPQKNPKRFNIFLDGEFAFGADEDLVVNWRLVPGKSLTISNVEQLVKETDVGKLMERMYRLFTIRQRSEKEVREYLKNLSFKRKVKGQEEISSFIVDTVVSRLKQMSFLDDVQFAKSWVEARRKSKRKGKIALKAELYQKGIGRELIDEILEEQSTPESEKELALQALEQKIRIWKNLPTLEFKKKAYGFLLRRGFEYEVVKDVIEKLSQKR